MRRYLNNNEGVTLVEVLVTIGLLGIIVVPVISMFISTARTNNLALSKMDATVIAQRVMENVKGTKDLDTIDRVQYVGNYTVEVLIHETNYKFLDSEPQQSQKSSPAETPYDVKIILDEDGNILSYYNLPEEDMLLISSTSPIINFKYQNDRITIDHGGNSVTVDVKGDAEIIFELYGNKNIFVFGENHHVRETVDLYFMKSPNSQCNYTFKNKEGNIRTYNNILINTSNKELNPSRVYKVDIKVENSKGELIEQISGYKTFLQ